MESPERIYTSGLLFFRKFYRRGIAGTRNNNKCTYSVDSYTLLSAGHVYLCIIKVYYK